MTEAPTAHHPDRLQWRLVVPFVAFHLALGLVLVTGVSWNWILIALASYLVRMFAVAAGYHRYFSHRAFKTSRLFQFVLAWVAQMSGQKGVLWWAAHHRLHHKHSDTEQDVHSPIRRGFWWSHLGWMFSRRNASTNYDSIKEFSRFPELMWLDEHWAVPPLAGLLLAGYLGGLPALVWAGIVPTVLLWHATFSLNSLGHLLGKRRYLTPDTSRNGSVLALITLGEGWHNNHHASPHTAHHGWAWWELDLTYAGLQLLCAFALVRELRVVRPEVKDAFREYSDAQRAELKAQSRIGRFEPQPPTPTPEARPAIDFDSALMKR